MNSLDEVPFRIPTDSPEAPPEEAELLSAPEPTGPDYLKILRETEYEFSLEKGVLAGLLGGNPGATWPAPVYLPCGPPPSCPPYWLMFNSPQESRRNSDLWEPGPRQRSHSLNTADLRCLHPRVKFIISDSEGEDGYSEDDEGSPSEDNAQGRRSPWPGDQAPMLKAFRHGSSPHLLGSSSPCGLARLRPGSPSVFPDSRRSPQPSRAGSPQCKGQRHPKRKPHLQASVSRRHSLTPQPTCFSPTSLPPPRPSTAGHIPSKSRKPAAPSPGPCSCLPPPHSVAWPQGSHTPLQDSSAELLSALSQEERELLEAITDQGYSLRTAIMALQKTGRQSPEQILGYLVACNRLCDLGYDEAQVEEALEMFQNCETKAAEFLCLLTQFNEMGFQQSAIKEVLLVHENHRERALEELMTREA